MLLNDDIVDIEKLDEICSPTFVIGKFSGLFLKYIYIYIYIRKRHLLIVIHEKNALEYV